MEKAQNIKENGPRKLFGPAWPISTAWPISACTCRPGRGHGPASARALARARAQPSHRERPNLPSRACRPGAFQPFIAIDGRPTKLPGIKTPSAETLTLIHFPLSLPEKNPPDPELVGDEKLGPAERERDGAERGRRSPEREEGKGHLC
jgi:hypothetical protein